VEVALEEKGHAAGNGDLGPGRDRGREGALVIAEGAIAEERADRIGDRGAGGADTVGGGDVEGDRAVAGGRAVDGEGAGAGGPGGHRQARDGSDHVADDQVKGAGAARGGDGLIIRYTERGPWQARRRQARRRVD